MSGSAVTRDEQDCRSEKREDLDIAMRIPVQEQLLADLCGQELEHCQIVWGQLSHQAVMAADIHISVSQ